MNGPRRDVRVFAFSLALMLAGALICWRGFMTKPGEPALEVPRREDWSAAEAKVLGAVFIIVGVYGLLYVPRNV